MVAGTDAVIGGGGGGAGGDPGSVVPAVLVPDLPGAVVPPGLVVADEAGLPLPPASREERTAAVMAPAAASSAIATASTPLRTGRRLVTAREAARAQVCHGVAEGLDARLGRAVCVVEPRLPAVELGLVEDVEDE